MTRRVITEELAANLAEEQSVAELVSHNGAVREALRGLTAPQIEELLKVAERFAFVPGATDVERDFYELLYGISFVMQPERGAGGMDRYSPEADGRPV